MSCPTSSPDQGAYGNTPAEDPQAATPRAHLALRFPDLYTDWERDKAHSIRWDSYGNTNESSCPHRSLPRHPRTAREFLQDNRRRHPRRRRVPWTPCDSGIDVGTYGLRIQISLVYDPTASTDRPRRFRRPRGRQQLLRRRRQRRQRRIHPLRGRLEPQHRQAPGAEAKPRQRPPGTLRGSPGSSRLRRYRHLPDALHRGALQQARRGPRQRPRVPAHRPDQPVPRGHADDRNPRPRRPDAPLPRRRRRHHHPPPHPDRRQGRDRRHRRHQ